jgi:hypothetical protein
MHKRMMPILCLAVLALSLAGCSKCGWLWPDGTRAGHGDAPLTR